MIRNCINTPSRRAKTRGTAASVPDRAVDDAPRGDPEPVELGLEFQVADAWRGERAEQGRGDLGGLGILGHIESCERRAEAVPGHFNRLGRRRRRSLSRGRAYG